MQQEVATIVRDCLCQKINFDPLVNDDGREWWYVSPLYQKDQELPNMSVEELEQGIKDLKFESIVDVQSFKIFDRRIIQVRGNRVAIINECQSFLKKK